MSEYGTLSKTDKSDLLKCLSDIHAPSFDENCTTAKAFVADVAVLVKMNAPKISKTYGEYADAEFIRSLDGVVTDASRFDCVFDDYRKDSIASITRENRSTGVRISVRKDTIIFKNFTEFMRDDDNKTELFKLLADGMVSSKVFQDRSTVIATKSSKIKSNVSIDASVLSPCNHQEADTRMYLHVLDCIRNGFKEIKIITVDTDVVVIALGCFFLLKPEKLWIEFGVGKHRR